MALVTVTVRNKDKLAAKLKQLAPAAQAELSRVNIVSADEMVSTARSYVPVKTGALRNSIRSQSVGGVETGAVRVLAGGPTTTKEVRSGSGKPYDYALGIEFGNSNTPRQSFFFTAYRLIRKRHRSRASRALNKSIKAVAGK
jgi:hypothetical protein